MILDMEAIKHRPIEQTQRTMLLTEDENGTRVYLHFVNGLAVYVLEGPVAQGDVPDHLKLQGGKWSWLRLERWEPGHEERERRLS